MLAREPILRRAQTSVKTWFQNSRTQARFMAHDVFLSYSSKDKFAADAACAVLERNGVRVWMAPRDILPGMEWGASIISAMHNARVVVLVFSGNANNSKQVRSEVERAINIGIPVIPFRIEDIEPRGSLELFLGAAHWLDAFTKPVEQHLDRLADVVRRVIEAQYGETDADRPRREKEEPAHRAAEDEERRQAAAAGEEERERAEAARAREERAAREQARAVSEQARAERRPSRRQSRKPACSRPPCSRR